MQSSTGPERFSIPPLVESEILRGRNPPPLRLACVAKRQEGLPRYGRLTALGVWRCRLAGSRLNLRPASQISRGRWPGPSHAFSDTGLTFTLKRLAPQRSGPRRECSHGKPRALIRRAEASRSAVDLSRPANRLDELRAVRQRPRHLHRADLREIHGYRAEPACRWRSPPRERVVRGRVSLDEQQGCDSASRPKRLLRFPCEAVVRRARLTACCPGSAREAHTCLPSGHPDDGNPGICGSFAGAGGGTRTPDTRIMIPLL